MRCAGSPKPLSEMGHGVGASKARRQWSGSRGSRGRSHELLLGPSGISARIVPYHSVFTAPHTNTPVRIDY